MTKYTTTYNFMDLLKDKGFVPGTDHVEENLSDENLVEWIAGFMAMLSGKINRTVAEYDYDFMDLLHDKGHVPAMVTANDNWQTEPANDNAPAVDVAS
ncbi:hypothetical protein [Luteithermobacter gelatinilyticus]|uniref:hypothetical protein n=1 Tax=Luteithermobacter gelatinilyticus TaxID=2582913 RepID=UPI0011070CB6|nr:hypothetical protein [Luteithermobacter gelatinilyticus]